LLAVILLLETAGAAAWAQTVPGSFYAIDCDPGSGACRLVRIELSGSAALVGTLGTATCARSGGGSITFSPSAIEGLDFDREGRLWGTGDNAAQGNVEYQFELDLADGSVRSCREMVLGGGLNVDDVGGLAPWDDAGRMVATDRSGADLLFIFDPLDHTWLARGDDPSDGHGRGLAKFPTQTYQFYSCEDGNQLFRITCAAPCTGNAIATTRVDLGVLFGVGGQHQEVNGLTAGPGGRLYGYDNARDTLIQIDPADASVDQEAFITGYIPASVNGLAYYDAGSGAVAGLTVALEGNGDVTLAWDPSCDPNDTDYKVYEGSLTGFYSHVPVACSTAGATLWTFPAQTGSRYFLVVPGNESLEGSYGATSGGAERPPAATGCHPQRVNPC
jgi:hypothetical protein